MPLQLRFFLFQLFRLFPVFFPGFFQLRFACAECFQPGIFRKGRRQRGDFGGEPFAFRLLLLFRVPGFFQLRAFRAALFLRFAKLTDVAVQPLPVFPLRSIDAFRRINVLDGFCGLFRLFFPRFDGWNSLPEPGKVFPGGFELLEDMIDLLRPRLFRNQPFHGFRVFGRLLLLFLQQFSIHFGQLFERRDDFRDAVDIFLPQQPVKDGVLPTALFADDSVRILQQAFAAVVKSGSRIPLPFFQLDLNRFKEIRVENAPENFRALPVVGQKQLLELPLRDHRDLLELPAVNPQKRGHRRGYPHASRHDASVRHGERGVGAFLRKPASVFLPALVFRVAPKLIPPASM